MYQNRYREGWMYAAAQRFCEFAGQRGYHPVSLAVAWVSRHPAVTAPIMGARSVAQVEDSLRSVEVDMTDALYDEISDLTPAPPPATDRLEERFE